MAEYVGTNQTLSEGDPLFPLVVPSVEDLMTEREKALRTELEECHETIYELKKKYREMENKLYETQLELARCKQREMGAQAKPGEYIPTNTNYYFNIDKVDQLNANVKSGAEVVHTMKN